jgi:hypothetical protein
MSDLEDLQEFENDAMHYISTMDRASAQLARLVQAREMALMSDESKHLRDNINGMGFKVSEYVSAERKRILDEADKEAQRT